MMIKSEKLSLLVAVMITICVISIECQGCISMVSNYYQCKNPNIELLNETFYASQKLNKMTLNQAIKLYVQIYKESLCGNSTCQCISKEVNTTLADFSLLFSSKSLLAALKTTIGGMNKDKKLLKHRYNLSLATLMVNYYTGVNSSSLATFCSKYEFSLLDAVKNFYDNFTYCATASNNAVKYLNRYYYF